MTTMIWLSYVTELDAVDLEDVPTWDYLWQPTRTRVDDDGNAAWVQWMRGRVMAGTRWRSGSGTLDADRALAVEPVVAIHLAIQSANGYNNRTSWPGPPRTAKKKRERYKNESRHQ